MLYRRRDLVRLAFTAGSAVHLAAAQEPAVESAGPPWKSMFDGSSLNGWKETPFTGRGKAEVLDGELALRRGGPLTGITWTGEFPTDDYEVRVQAMRAAGSDFFAAITFPVGKSFCSWINGGWGGTVVGLSSIDGMDASENETAMRRDFENNRWYALWLRVTQGWIEAWIDAHKIIEVDLRGKTVGLRPGEIELSIPFGIASYATTARIKQIEYRSFRAAAEPNR